MSNFLDLDLLTPEQLRTILEEAARRKAERKIAKIQCKGATDLDTPLAGFVLALLFQRPSTRTRISFDIAIRQLGGVGLYLSGKELQLQRGESLHDTSKVLSRYVDAIVFRTNEHSQLDALVDAAEVPVINGLSEHSHPCQVMADILTFEEHKGPIQGCTLSWIGDGGNNMATSWIHAATLLRFRLQFGCPEKFAPQSSHLTVARDKGADIELYTSAEEAVQNSDCVMTDAWISMSDSADSADERRRLLAPYNINDTLMENAPEAIFMHCLPAHRGEEVSDSVLDSQTSVVFDEAENRLHAQKAILLYCLDKLAKK